jgi:hypothetical protein
MHVWCIYDATLILRRSSYEGLMGSREMRERETFVPFHVQQPSDASESKPTGPATAPRIGFGRAGRSCHRHVSVDLVPVYRFSSEQDGSSHLFSTHDMTNV